MSMSCKKILVVGAGLSGAVVAREMAEQGHQVTVIDKRNHVAGNAYDFVNEYGIRVHQYGPHLFHTSNDKVVAWLSRFTEWLPYQHKVKALLADGRHVTLPVNKETSELVGKENVLDIFFRPYTQKMWGVELEDLDPTIRQRVPIRDDLNELYFPNDTFQALPKAGYTQMVKNILDHERIQVQLSVAYDKRMNTEHDWVFNAMPIDEYFDFKHGPLPYRSIKFHTITVPIPKVLPTATVNFTHSEPFTRTTEWQLLPGHGKNPAYTTLTTEEPCDYKDNHMERYYPVKDSGGENLARYRRYEAEPKGNVTFIGRCGLYAYLDMHQAVSSALSISQGFQKVPPF